MPDKLFSRSYAVAWQQFVSLTLSLFLAASALADQSNALPRKSPEFTIFEPSGKTILLSSLKGKVVVIEFLFVRSPHCLRVAQTLNRLHGELEPRGFQSVAIVFGPGASGSAVNNLVQYFKLGYPVGYTSSDKVDSFLGREGNKILTIPQVVVIDRAGMIRATSGTKGDLNLENEGSLRRLIDSLLVENTHSASKSPTVSSSKPVTTDRRQ
jgi:peroxiredoxin